MAAFGRPITPSPAFVRGRAKARANARAYAPMANQASVSPSPLGW
jgi:hypothetical protein